MRYLLIVTSVGCFSRDVAILTFGVFLVSLCNQSTRASEHQKSKVETGYEVAIEDNWLTVS